MTAANHFPTFNPKPPPAGRLPEDGNFFANFAKAVDKICYNLSSLLLAYMYAVFTLYGYLLFLFGESTENQLLYLYLFKTVFLNEML